MPFAGVIGHVGPYCPRVLFNRELVGTHNSDEPPMFFGNIGLRVDEPENYRDIFVAGDCDATVERLCALLGWTSALDQLELDYDATTACEDKGFLYLERQQAEAVKAADFDACEGRLAELG